MSHITASHFIDRFVSMVIDGRDFPKKRLDRQILFISVILSLEPQRRYSELELNCVLRHWTDHFGVNIGLDHVTLRRFLVDERFLKRDAAGMSYELEINKKRFVTFDRSIKLLEPKELINKSRKEREKRKQHYMKKSMQ